MKINNFSKFKSKYLKYVKSYLLIIGIVFLCFRIGYYIFQLDLPTVMNFYVVHIAFGVLSGGIVFVILGLALFITGGGFTED